MDSTMTATAGSSVGICGSRALSHSDKIRPYYTCKEITHRDITRPLSRRYPARIMVYGSTLR